MPSLRKIKKTKMKQGLHRTLNPIPLHPALKVLQDWDRESKESREREYENVWVADTELTVKMSTEEENAHLKAVAGALLRSSRHLPLLTK